VLGSVNHSQAYTDYKMGLTSTLFQIYGILWPKICPGTILPRMPEINSASQIKRPIVTHIITKDSCIWFILQG
jgi:hypothetical protein